MVAVFSLAWVDKLMFLNSNKKYGRDTSSKALSFLRLTASFDFIFALINDGVYLIQSLNNHIISQVYINKENTIEVIYNLN